MNNETARQAYIRLLREAAKAVDSFPPDQRDGILKYELVKDECLDGVLRDNSSGFPIGAILFGIKPKGRLFLQELENQESRDAVSLNHKESFNKTAIAAPSSTS
jgi:hypothetical protein